MDTIARVLGLGILDSVNSGQGCAREPFGRDRDETRDVQSRDRDETETFDFMSETRPRPRPFKIFRDRDQDRDLSILLRDETETETFQEGLETFTFTCRRSSLVLLLKYQVKHYYSYILYN